MPRRGRLLAPVLLHCPAAPHVRTWLGIGTASFSLPLLLASSALSHISHVRRTHHLASSAVEAASPLCATQKFNYCIFADLVRSHQ
jgi:hypothetical protein